MDSVLFDRPVVVIERDGNENLPLLQDMVVLSSILKYEHTMNMPKHYKGKKSRHKFTVTVHK